MRRDLTTLAVCVFLLVPAVLAETDPIVRITEVHPDPETDGREFIELWNGGDTDVDITGWTLSDTAGNTFTFPTWTLGPDDLVVVWGGGDDPVLGATFGTTVWNNGGDTVTIADAAGVVVDSMTYGSNGIPSPPKGISLHFEGSWIEGPPSPGQANGQDGGGATATVEDVPPRIRLVDVPERVAPGAAVDILFDVEEDNGDTVSWSAQADGTTVAEGSGTGSHIVSASAPDATGDWVWAIIASDGDQDTVASFTIVVTTDALLVRLPQGPISFPAMVPGASNATAAQPFTVSNLGSETLVPRIDISPFRSDVGSIPVDANLHLLVDDGEALVRIDYMGPLQAMPALVEGGAYDVWLVIDHVPLPLPAGTYSTSFTVVA